MTNILCPTCKDGVLDECVNKYWQLCSSGCLVLVIGTHPVYLNISPRSHEYVKDKLLSPSEVRRWYTWLADGVLIHIGDLDPVFVIYSDLMVEEEMLRARLGAIENMRNEISES